MPKHSEDANVRERPTARVSRDCGEYEVQVWREGSYRTAERFGGTERLSAIDFANGFNAAVEWVERYDD